MRFTKDILGGLPKTVHGGEAWKLKGVEDHSHNLNPLGPPEGLMEIISSSVPGIDHYPDDSCCDLRGAIARQFGVNDSNIVMGAGSSEIIRNFPLAFLSQGDRALIFRPSFAEYSHQCRTFGVEVSFKDLAEDDDLRIDRDGLSDRISSGIKALYICNPNNPTGRVEPREKVMDIVKECSDNDVLVFLDETLLELVPGHKDISCVKYVKDHDNLVVAGSITKSFAVPGIRVGYGIMNESLAEEMNKVRMTWNIGHMEQNVARVLISDHMDHVEKAAKMMAEESKVMRSELGEIGFPVGDLSDSFFYFCSLKELGIKCAELRNKMLEHRIMVRDCASFGSPFEWYVRFSVKDRERNEAFVKAAEESLKELR